MKTNVNEWYKNLEPEEQVKEERYLELKNDIRLEKLMDSYDRFDNIMNKMRVEKYYDWILIAKSLIFEDFNENTINDLMFLLSRKKTFYNSKGLFLNSLIETYNGDRLSIRMFEPLKEIAYRNTKNIEFSGNIGDLLGYQMQSGSITINGDANDKLGAGLVSGKIKVNGNVRNSTGTGMVGGEIEITGNCRDSTGLNMEDGKIIIRGDSNSNLGSGMRFGDIIIEGDAGRNVGEFMMDGNIHLNGTYITLSRCIRGGNIYHKGGLIVKHGKPVKGKNVKIEY